MTPLMFIMLFAFCQSTNKNPEQAAAKVPAAQAKPASVPLYDMKPDTIEIRGKFTGGCTVPGMMKIALHNVDNTFWKDVTVNPNGEFSFRHYLTEPRRVALRTIYGVKFDFFTTTKEKVYNIEISCPNKTETFEIKGSPENEAYIPFSEANKKLKDTLDSLGKQDISKPEIFALVKQTLLDYQKTLADIAKAHPGTFTAQAMCTADKLPDGSLDSPEALRKNFLRREAYGNPQIYNDFLPQRILLNYLAIRGKNSNPDEAIETLMSTVSGNVEAAKRLQDNVNSIFYKMHQEDLVIAFMNWAERNPGKMYNQSVKGRLQNLRKVVSGAPMQDFELKDPSGKPHKLSETVKSAKLTLLIFYSPTCGHCKEKVPEFLPVWEQYKNKGLKIVAVGNTAKPDEWATFIKTKGSPEWVNLFEYEDGPHPSDLYYAETPSFLLIDRQGTIVSRVWDLEHVIEDIHERLK